MPRSLLVIQHADFEGPGLVADWAAERGLPMRLVHAHRSAAFPAADSFDLLVLMGGPMSVYEIDRNPWLEAELEFVSKVIASRKRVLGICLGAQILARQLGASVAPQETPEIGWYPVRMTRKGRLHPLFAGFPARFDALHWHGDRFAIPSGGERIAESDACPTQAFVWGDCCVGLQFHLESTNESVASLIEGSYDEDETGPYVMTAEQLRAGIGRTPSLRQHLNILLDRLMELPTEALKE